MAFVGSSSFSSDFDQVIERAVAIAGLPLRQLRIQRQDMVDRSTAFGTIETAFTDLQTAITTLGTTLTSSSHEALVSDETIASVTLSGDVLSADYSIDVTDIGARTLTLSPDGMTAITDPFTQTLSASTSFTLTVDGVAQTITADGGSLFGLASAINATNSGVQATVVNIGGAAGNDYRLSVQSTKFAATTIQLNDGSQDLLSTLSTGSPVIYTVNGVPAGGISADSRTVTLSPGVTVNLRKVGAADISIAQTASSVGDAVAGLVTAYNAIVDKLDLQRGTSGGVLSGQVVLSTLQRSLAGINGYDAGTGNLRTLADIGVTLDDTGRLALDRSQLESKSVTDVLAFLGDSTTGFLKSASDLMDSLQDPESGLVALERESIKRQLDHQDDMIQSNEERIETMRQNLIQRMAAADAIVAVLEQQANGIAGLFAAMSANRQALK